MRQGTYGINKLLKELQRGSIIPAEHFYEPRNRTRSFKDKMLTDMVDRAEREGIHIEMETKPVPPTPKEHHHTVLPSHGTRILKDGIRPATGVFATVHDMQELDDNAFLLFYLETTREYEKRMEDKGWTGHVMEHVLSIWEKNVGGDGNAMEEMMGECEEVMKGKDGGKREEAVEEGGEEGEKVEMLDDPIGDENLVEENLVEEGMSLADWEAVLACE